jgi:5-methylcytosine-specific restriction protein B
VAYVRSVRDASPEQWVQASFQEALWDRNPISNIGPGRSVTVVGAYTDRELAEILLKARDQPREGSPADRGKVLQGLYDQILAHVHPRYTKRRPRARVVRLLAAMFPEEMTCLMDAQRIWRIQGLIGAAKIATDFVGQNPVIKARLHAVLGDPKTIEENVDQSVFNWFLWETYCSQPEPGAIEASQPEPTPTDAPPLSLMPAAAERRSPTFVRDNIGLLMAVMREAEQGITRPDLIGVIQREAPQLSQGSASIIISQAQGGVGLIRLHDGAFRPTERGMELLNAPEPAAVLRAPLVGRFFGMGHLLLLLRRSLDGIPQQELAKRVSATCPTWTSARPGQELTQWALATGLAQVSTGGGSARLLLTEDGEDFAAALPADFEERWRLQLDPASPVQNGETEADLPAGFKAPIFQVLKWPALRDQFRIGILSSKLILAEERLAELHTAMHASDRKRFVLLAGLSGTGKTLLARVYADAYCHARGLVPSHHYHQVAVQQF